MDFENYLSEYEKELLDELFEGEFTYDFINDFNGTSLSFSEEYCDFFEKDIIDLLTSCKSSSRQELKKRFTKKLFGYVADTDDSEFQRCLFHLPDSFIRRLRIEFEKRIMDLKIYNGNLVFLFLRYLDLFAYQTKLLNLFFGANIIAEISTFNMVCVHFFKNFQKQRKKIDLLPIFRTDKKYYLKKDYIEYQIVNKTYKEISAFTLDYVNVNFNHDTRQYSKIIKKIYYFIVFNYSKVQFLNSDTKDEYYAFVLGRE
jgi:hypothetical protein